MRKCLIFLALLIVTLIIAVMTDHRTGLTKNNRIVMGDSTGYTLLAEKSNSSRIEK